MPQMILSENSTRVIARSKATKQSFKNCFAKCAHNDNKTGFPDSTQIRILKGWLLLLTSVWLCAGCDAVYRLLQKAGAEERDLIGEAVPFEANPKVKEVQQLLKLYGYSVGKIDGKLGVKTRESIAAFQEHNGLEVTRFVDKVTWKKLNRYRELGLVIDGELNIQGLQQALTQLGYDPGPADGKMGNKTKSAILAFQKANGLKPDGRVGFKTLGKLSEYFE